MDLFKDHDSSSSDENENTQVTMNGVAGGASNNKDDFMAFNDTAKIIPLSNRYKHMSDRVYRETGPDCIGRRNERYE